MNKIIYKRLRIEDAKTIYDFVEHAFFDCANICDFWTYNEIVEWLSCNDDCCMAAYDGKNLIGFCLTHYHKAVSKVHIENIFVVEKYRKRGIASSLIQKIESFYLSKGSRLRFVAMINADNYVALSFMKKMGYLYGEKMIWIQKNLR